VVELARDKGLAVIAITDHDTTAGIQEAIAAGRDLGIKVIPGVEISADLDGEEVHILGYGFSYLDPVLNQVFMRLQKAREERAKGIFHLLNQLGFHLTWDEILSQVGDADSFGRPHFARAMIVRGYVASVAEAFDRFLNKGQPAWVERYKLSPREAIDVIHRAGGLAFLAHPGIYQRGRDLSLALLQEGLDGLEVFHSDHSPEQNREYLNLAQQYGAYISGGSDCHGAARGQQSLMGKIAVEWPYLEPWLNGLMD
jgi:predicted metal-dependent phosphoesterase TrpH